MIGLLTYEEIADLTNSIAKSSNNIREIINKYNSDCLFQINGFCDSVDAYTRFLTTNIELYQDSEKALKFMIEKNK